jgi:hypothetical protein
MPRTDVTLLQRTRDRLDRGRDQVTRLQATARDVVERMPATAAADVRASVARLHSTRSPREALGALEAELESIFETITPALAEFPLPIRSEMAALTTVTIVAGTAAAVDEIELLGMLLPGTHAIAVPSLPLVLAASFVALVVEAYVAGSLRVHTLRETNRAIDPHDVTRDVLRAMTGRDDVTFTKTAAKSLSRRMLRRWGRSIIPFVGVAYSSWDARRTIRMIARMPMTPLPLDALPAAPR